jgi:putative ABC transport system ATP-binding protein
MGTMNALENVALPLTFQGISKKERIKRAKRMIHMVGLDKYWDHKPNQMSGGQQQRVGVARALVVRPEIIFADEPTGNLDSNTSREIMNLMQSVVREHNQTLIMVTHDNTLAGFADRIIRIVDGKIVDMIDNREEKQDEKQDEKHDVEV